MSSTGGTSTGADDTTTTPTTTPTTTIDPGTSTSSSTTSTDTSTTTGDSTTGGNTTGSSTGDDSTTGDSTSIGSTTEGSSTGDSTTGGSSTGSSTGDSSTGDSSTGSSTGVPAQDLDADGIVDGEDNCVEATNPGQEDGDGDKVGDLCDEEVINNADLLLVPAGQLLDLGGEHCYAQVFIFGTVKVPVFADNDTTGTLTLKADTITVGPLGLVIADAAGHAGGAKAPFNGGLEGGGPGKGCGGGPGNAVGQGGTGASYGGVGAGPNNTFANGNPCAECSQAVAAHCEGATSLVQGTDNGEEINLGSGGGAGGNSSGCNNAGGSGGRGGGAILLLANDWVNIEGVVSALGEEPAADDGQCGYRPGGGGGSGGGIVVAADLVIGPVTATLRASGGNGGEALGEVVNQTWGWGGGGGGGGRIKLYAPMNQWSGNSEVTGGLGGKFPATGQSFGGDPGANGSAFVGDVLPAIYDNLSCN